MSDTPLTDAANKLCSKAAKAGSWDIALDHMRLHAQDMELQRAELAAALERTLHWLASYPGGDAEGAYEQAYAALAKVRP